MTNTWTDAAEKLAAKEGLDVLKLDGGEDEHITIRDVREAAKDRDAAAAKAAEDAENPPDNTKLQKVVAPPVPKGALDGTIVYLGLGNSAFTVQHGVDKVIKANPNAKIVVQSIDKITGDNVECHQCSVSRFIRANKEVFNDSPIAINGFIDPDPERIRKGLNLAHRPQDEKDW